MSATWFRRKGTTESTTKENDGTGRPPEQSTPALPSWLRKKDFSEEPSVALGQSIKPLTMETCSHTSLPSSSSDRASTPRTASEEVQAVNSLTASHSTSSSESQKHPDEEEEIQRSLTGRRASVSTLASYSSPAYTADSFEEDRASTASAVPTEVSYSQFTATTNGEHDREETELTRSSLSSFVSATSRQGKARDVKEVATEVDNKSVAAEAVFVEDGVPMLARRRGVVCEEIPPIEIIPALPPGCTSCMTCGCFCLRH